MTAAVYAIATMDTKGQELAFAASCLREAGVAVRTVDVGTFAPPQVAPDVTREQITGQRQTASPTDRGTAVTAMSAALCRFLAEEHAAGRVSAVLGLGGSGGTALITPAMRELPIGLPKLMVSTVASGNTAPYVDCTDIIMMYSVVDVAGLNVVLKRILSNAAHAVAGMVARAGDRTNGAPAPAANAAPARPAVAMTMFGVTTPCVTAVRETLEAEGFDCLVFHATGTGGRAMEQLVRSQMIGGVLDITTTEVADEVVGGVFPAGPHRFEALLAAEIPLVLSVGAVDMVNFGPLESVPERFRDRNLHVHNAQVTLMRTSPAENREIAAWIAAKLNRATGPFTVLLPEGGVSMLDALGQPFYDPVADQALFNELESRLELNEQRRLERLPWHVNDPEFAAAVVDRFRRQLANRG